MYQPSATAFVADYYTTPDRWLVAAAKAADAGDDRIAEFFETLIAASVAAESGEGTVEACESAERELLRAWLEEVDDDYEAPEMGEVEA